MNDMFSDSELISYTLGSAANHAADRLMSRSAAQLTPPFNFGETQTGVCQETSLAVKCQTAKQTPTQSPLVLI